MDDRRHRKEASAVRTAMTGDPVGRVGMGLFLVLAVLPVVFALGYAIAYSVGLAGLLGTGFSGAAWRGSLSSPEIWLSLAWSLYVAIVTTVLAVSAGFAAALLLRQSVDKSTLSYALFVPLAIPAAVSAFLVMQLFSGAGHAARWAEALGVIDRIERFPGLVHDGIGAGIIVAHLGTAVPWFAILFRQIYVGERLDEYIRTARSLGAGPLRSAMSVAVPVMLSRAAPNLVLYFVAVLGSFEIPLLLGRQSPEMLSVLTLRKYSLFDLSQRPDAFIAALVYSSLALVVLAVSARRGWLAR